MIEERIWKPFKKQEEFLALPDSIKEALFGGAAGPGKSETLLMLPIVRQFHTAPRFKGLLLRRTFPELDKEIILRSQAPGYYFDTGAKYNREDKRWKWPSGAIMQFGHCEYESDVRKYDTSEYNLIAWDELTSFTEFQYLYLSLTRCRSATAELPAIIRAATNPGNIGHGWVRKRFIEPGPYGTIVRDPKTKEKRIFIQALLTDNPLLMKNNPSYIHQLEGLPEAEKRAKLYGDWWTFEGQVFEDWRENPLPGESENAKHIIEPFDIPSWWPRTLAIDWGFRAYTIAYWAAISPDRRLFIYREYAAKETKISTWATDVGRISEGEDLVDIVMDPSAWGNRGDEKTIAEQFEFHSGLRPRRADNERISGKILFQEYLRWKDRPPRRLAESSFDPDVAEKILRMNGIDKYHEYCNLFLPEKPELNLPKLQVFNSCTHLRKCLPLCIYDKNQKEDVAPFDGDDSYDCSRYLIKAADYYMANAARGMETREKISQAIQSSKLDQTAFYRKMEMIERKGNGATVSVRRFH